MIITRASVCRSERRRIQGGFSLIATLMIMSLLAVISMGLMSLSTIEMRSVRGGGAMADARANARTALQLAIGQLQKSLGPDQRVSANGEILASPSEGGSVVRHGNWIGVWDSWKAGETDSSETALDLPSEHQTIEGVARGGMHPTYAPNREDHFRSWLVSLNPEEAAEISTPVDLELRGDVLPEGDAEAVRLVGEGTVGNGGDREDFVHVRLLDLDNGRYGWWVGDESQKARIMDDSYESQETTPSLAEKVFRGQAPGTTGTRVADGLTGVAPDGRLGALPTRQTLDLVQGASGRPSENFHHLSTVSLQVLADVREGGLKRDLSTLLERPIDLAEDGDEFMLYKFDAKDSWSGGPTGQERVPIQDLAAYYQLYDGDRADRNEGVRYSSNLLSEGIHAVSPDFGAKNESPDKYYRKYTTLYRSPAPIKVQMLLNISAVERTQEEKDALPQNTDTHKLLVGVTPALTLWNPTNVPLAMRFDGSNPNLYAQLIRMGNLPLHIKWIKNGGAYVSPKKNLFWFVSGVDNYKPHLFNMYYSGVRPIRFEPGEVKVLSLPYRGDVSGLKASYRGNWGRWRGDFFFKTDLYYEPLEASPGWDPTAFMWYRRSAPGNGEHVQNNSLTFKATDQISFEVTADSTALSGGSAMMFHLIQTNHQSYAGGGTWDRRNYQLGCRNGQGNNAAHKEFNQRLLTRGFPADSNGNPVALITSAPRSGQQIIQRSINEDGWPFLQFSLMAGSETHEMSNGGSFAGRKFASRPFLHSTSLAASYIDGEDSDSLYHYGWNWWVEDINSVFEANIQVSPNNQGYYGGGYTPESGATHVVQQEIPVVPPISIAALSHAHLGGFSLANDSVRYGYPDWTYVTATGQAGLAPHTLQAIGNSYAHPYIPADKAFTNWDRVLYTGQASKPTILADHSYLANKALWDEFFFSSISPFPEVSEVFGDAAGRSAEESARAFFFDGVPLPNRRMVSYSQDFSEGDLGRLFADAEEFRDGLADKIAAHLMVEGPFNVNSTSEEAWKVFLSSLKGKKVAYLDKGSALSGGIRLDEATPSGTPVSPVSLPNGQPTTGGTSDPSEIGQWTGWRELTDVEIGKLAEAIVKQVKLRGPFLSLSEFVNRRLDSGNRELSVKGALQAALDDEAVPINAGFRNATRQFSDAEISDMNPDFPEALEGPVAYGSSAYIDQADLLRHFAGQLTPRGDTFVIRTYGDSLDADGNVVARAWCEAVVQRVPDYLDPADEPHVKAGELSSQTNKTFGRKMRIVSFRWLNPSEV